MSSHKASVLYVTHASNLTGASRSLLDLLGGLDRARVSPTVLLRCHGPLESKLDELSIPYRIVPYSLATIDRYEPKMAAVKRPVAMFLRQFAVNDFIKNACFDLVHNNSLLVDAGMFAAQQYGIPYLAHVRELVYEDHGGVFVNETRTKRLLQGASEIVYISRFVSDKFASWAPNTPSRVVYNAVNPSSYYREHKALMQGDAVRLLFAGTFAPGKGSLEAIQATELLRNNGTKAHLTIVGGIRIAEYYEECISYINEHALRDCVEILDFTDDLSSLRANNDISLVCSRSEAMGRVTIEGMLSGCLVIGAAAGATTELVEHLKTGLLYQSGNPESLAEAIEWAIAHQNSAQRIASAGQDWAYSTFDVDTYARDMMGVYDEILNR